MRKKIYGVLLLVLCITFFSSAINATNTTEKISDIFKNQKFAQTIATKLNKSIDDEVTQDDLDTVTGASIVVGSGNVDSLEGIGRLTNLKGFILSSSKVEEIPAEIANLKKLAVLDINGSEIKEIPSEVSELSELQTLDLSQNKIESVPSSLSKLEKVTLLDLSQNNIIDYNASMIGATEINLSTNNLSEFPIKVTDSKNLQTLKLANNKLSSIDMSLDNLESISEIDVSNNKITSKVPNVVFKENDKVDKWSLTNHSQSENISKVYVYNGETIKTEMLMPDLIKQIKEDNNGTLSGLAKWYITKPSGGSAVTINAGSGTEFESVEDLFTQNGTYKIQLAMSNNSMRYWGYSSYSIELVKVDAEKPVVTGETEINLKVNEEIDLPSYTTNLEDTTLSMKVEDESIVKLENGKLIGLKEGSTTKSVIATDVHGGCSEPLVVNINVTKVDVDPGEEKPVTSQVIKKGASTYYYKLVSGKWFNYKVVTETKNKITTYNNAYVATKKDGVTATPWSKARFATKTIVNYKNSVVVKKQIIKYNVNNKMTSNKIYQYKNKKAIMTYSRTVSYYANNKVKQSTVLKKNINNKYTSKQKVKYSSKGLKKSMTKFSYKNGKVSKRVEYKYNSKGKLKTYKNSKGYKYTTTYKNGKAKKTYRQTYNKKGKLTKKITVKIRKAF